MFFVTQAEIDQIRGKMRRRVLHLPVEHERIKGTARHPRTGRTLSACDVVGGKAIKRCPLRERSVTTLAPGVTHAQYRAQAQAQPTRARGVLWFLDRCETLRTVTITVTKVERQRDVWLVRFEKGERQELFDRDVFLCRQNDFTMDASRQTVRGDAPYLAPLAEDMRRARAKASERRVSPQQQLVSKMQGDAETLAQSLAAMKDRQRLKRVEFLQREMSKLAVQFSVDERGIVSTSAQAESAHAESPVPPASEVGAERPEGVCSPAPLTEAELESLSESDLAQIDAEADRVVAVALQSPA